MPSVVEAGCATNTELVHSYVTVIVLRKTHEEKKSFTGLGPLIQMIGVPTAQLHQRDQKTGHTNVH